jgi:hypothetical protein
MRTSLALAVVALTGCPDRSISGITTEPGTVDTLDTPASPARAADVLFVIDDSGSMAEEQASLRANFSRFMSVLQTLDGGQPDLHIGVATSDLGTSATDGSVFGTAFGCSGKGDDGNLRTTPTVTGRFIVDDGLGNHNYSGTLEDAFSALADVGTKGCGIEQHIGSMERALENPANAGFVRDDAVLAVVIIGDEDDCSLAKSSLFGVSQNPPTVNFECTKDGVECDSNPGDMTTPGMRTNCHPSAHAHEVQSTDRFVQFLKAQKPDERQLVVAGIVGDPTPFGVELDSGTSVLSPSCTYGVQNAFPAVRTSDFIGQFVYSARATICGADLSNGLTEIGAALVKAIGTRCLEHELVDADPTTPTLDPDCAVSDVRRVPGGADQELAQIPACASGAAVPCWRVVDDPVHCNYTHIDPHYALEIDRGGITPPPGVFVKAQCVVTQQSGPQS